MVEILEPKLHKLIAQIPISRWTNKGRLGVISKSAANNLIWDLQNCTAFSLAQDESTDIQDVPQLAIFFYVHPNTIIKEEILDLGAFIETTRWFDIRNTLDEIINRFELPHNKLLSVATDGTSTMTKKNLSRIGLLNNDPKIPLHCIIFQIQKCVKECFVDCEFN